MSRPRIPRAALAVLGAGLVAFGAGCGEESKGSPKKPAEERALQPEPKTEALPEIPPPKDLEPEPAKPAETPKETPPAEPAPAEPAPAPAPDEKPIEAPKEAPPPAESAMVQYHCDSCGSDKSVAATEAVPNCCGNPMTKKAP